jgi:hypothetical protein
MAGGMINYRTMLEEMRGRDKRGRNVKFDLCWVQVDGTWREEHGVELPGQKSEMKRIMVIDIRYPNASHHDTEVRVLNIVSYNGKRVFF